MHSLRAIRAMVGTMISFAWDGAAWCQAESNLVLEGHNKMTIKKQETSKKRKIQKNVARMVRN